MSNRTIDRLAAALSENDLQLLRFVRSSRFTTTKQLARFQHARYTTDASALRQTSRAMRALTDLGLTSHLDRQIGGRRSGSTGLIWALTPLGHRVLDQVNGREPRRRYRPEEEPSTTFLEHTLAITEVHLTLFELARATDGEVLLVKFEREPASWRRYLDRTRGAVHLRSDAYAEVQVGEYRDSYFLEADRATEAPVVVVRKCLQYQQYRRAGLEQRANGVFPAVLWITPHVKRTQQLRERLKQELGLPRDLLRVVTIDDLAAHVRAGPEGLSP